MKINRLFVVGDLHGSYDNLCRHLVDIDFDFKHDLLISVGDLVDRGKKSLECLNLLNKPWFKAVRGNHEQMCIDGMLNHKIRNIHKDERNGGEWFYKLSKTEQKRIVELLKEIPLYLEIEYKGELIGFVHANVEQNDWLEFKDSFNQKDIVDVILAMNQTLWSRNRFNDETGAYQKVKNIDRIYLGHTIVDYPVIKHNCHFIDTGAYKTGNLTIVEI
ncbi:metallophosphoesterase [Acinetobacter baumannii]|uniref:metallophosphoesterase n=1 Tax=Acinetobacter baumannii TaxID=470 RepID=UPI00112CED8B|nr:metallophosphoesterase [Acinetobacter baumannii]TPS38635.1 serine/threonine-protein phosphatase 2 [Acinetobacter baumannii]